MMINIRNELCITSCWTLDGWSHGVSGHIFEIIDYYYTLKNKYDTCILLCEPSMTPEWFRRVVTQKYDFSEDEIDDIIKSTKFHNTPKYMKCNKILFVDGCLVKMQQSGIHVFYDVAYTFKCSKYETVHDLEMYADVIPLLDYRVYNNVNDSDVDIGINYVKKILLDRYKSVENDMTNTAMIYATKNCRKLTNEQLDKIIHTYKFDKYIVVTDVPEVYKQSHDNIITLQPPVKNLFEKFNTYIYTPTLMRWDGSPRFLVECDHYQKDVIYHDIDDQYLEHDRGLYFRIQDIQSDRESLHLKQTDNILNII
jgi:hypothetical protein